MIHFDVVQRKRIIIGLSLSLIFFALIIFREQVRLFVIREEISLTEKNSLVAYDIQTLNGKFGTAIAIYCWSDFSHEKIFVEYVGQRNPLSGIAPISDNRFIVLIFPKEEPYFMEGLDIPISININDEWILHNINTRYWPRS